jgi:hypothetical protein
MKRGIVIFLLVISFAAGFYLRAQRGGVLQTGSSPSKAVDVVSLGERKKLTEKEWIGWLEKFGRVPDDADYHEWVLAARTSWWGKPIDPKRFWQRRVVWLDNSATMAAQRLGRFYPPLPYEDPAVAKRSVLDYMGQGGPEGGSLPLHENDQERGFWLTFYRTHPVPPEEIDRKQTEVEERILAADHWQNSPEVTARIKESIRTEAFKEANYPSEAFSEDSLFWAYVLKKREEYRKLNDPAVRHNPLEEKLFIGRLAIDPKYVKEPLTEQQVQTAGAWKVVYLNRLQKENTDASYINAYLQAWNLPPNVITNGTNR